LSATSFGAARFLDGLPGFGQLDLLDTLVRDEERDRLAGQGLVRHRILLLRLL